MKKLFLSAAVLAMLASCQNEAIVEQSEMQQGGEFISLSISKGSESRTALGQNNATVWSEGDQIYVCGNNGKVTGVLKLVDGVNGVSGTFEGYVFGGKQLDYVVFPVPQNGKINMGAREAGKLDAPMVGTINSNNNGETTASLNNVGGLLAIKVEGGQGQKLKVEASNASVGNMTGGIYTFNPFNGTLQYASAAGAAETVVNNKGWAYIPVATTTQATNGKEETATTINVDVTVKNVQDVTISSGTGITITSGDIMGDGKNSDGEQETSTGLDVKTIDNETGLKEAIAQGKNIVLGDNIELKTSIFIDAEKNITINLNGYNIVSPTTDVFEVNGTLNVYGDNNSLIQAGLNERKTDIKSICAVWAYNGGTANIYGGHYVTVADQNGKRNDCIYAGSNSKETPGFINIYDGIFEFDSTNLADFSSFPDTEHVHYWGDVHLLNGANGKGSKITVYGGEFKNHVPGKEATAGNTNAEEVLVSVDPKRNVYVKTTGAIREVAHTAGNNVWYVVK